MRCDHSLMRSDAFDCGKKKPTPALLSEHRRRSLYRFIHFRFIDSFVSDHKWSRRRWMKLLVQLALEASADQSALIKKGNWADPRWSTLGGQHRRRRCETQLKRRASWGLRFSRLVYYTRNRVWYYLVDIWHTHTYSHVLAIWHWWCCLQFTVEEEEGKKEEEEEEEEQLRALSKRNIKKNNNNQIKSKKIV